LPLLPNIWWCLVWAKKGETQPVLGFVCARRNAFFWDALDIAKAEVLNTIVKAAVALALAILLQIWPGQCVTVWSTK